jgi:hypothetical protein
MSSGETADWPKQNNDPEHKKTANSIIFNLFMNCKINMFRCINFREGRVVRDMQKI